MEQERLHRVGDLLRRGYATPTDTMITADLPLLLTRLAQLRAGRADGRSGRSGR